MKITRATKKLQLLGAVLLGLASGAAYAGDVFFNLDTPPDSSAGFLILGSHYDAGRYWYPTNGNPDTGGFLSIGDGDAGAGQLLVALFPSVDVIGGIDYPVKAFHLTADLRVGNGGRCGGRPADGFSISYCREGDPVLVNATNNAANGAAGGDGCPVPVAGSGDLENGTMTGVSIIFDAWSGNNLPDTGPGGTCGPDTEGIEVRVDNKTLLQLDQSADRNGNCNYDATTNPDMACNAAVCTDSGSQQTGGWWSDFGGLKTAGQWWSNELCWARLDVELTADKKVTVIWKGTTLVDHFQLAGYNSHRGRLVLMGRTGGCDQSDHFDNIHLVTTPAVEATFGGVSASGLNGFQFTINDNGAAVVTSVPVVKLDGADVTSQVTLTHTAGVTTGVYTQANNFPSGSQHNIDVTWVDSIPNTNSVTGQTFTVGAWVGLSAALAVPDASVDLTQPGFFIKVTQTTNGVQPNRLFWTDEQLEGLQGLNLIDFSSVLNSTNGEVMWNSAVDLANGTPNGQFSGGINNDLDWAFLGVPAPNTAFATPQDNTSAAFMGYAYFPQAGTYTFGGNSDDGIRLTFAQNSHDLIGQEVPGMTADVGRGIGNDQNSGSVLVSTPGYYGCRLLFENGTGGCNVEFYTTFTPASGAKHILVNDTNTANYLKIYMISTAGQAYISAAEPPMNDDQVFANKTLFWDIKDSATTVSGAPTLSINGVAQTPTITNPSAGVTHIVVSPSPLWTQGSNWVSIQFTDSAGPRSYGYSFTVQPYVVLNTNTMTALGSGSNPGFRMKDFQSPNTNLFNGWDNTLSQANAAMNGVYGADISDKSILTHSGYFWNSTVINFAEHDPGTVYDAGNFAGDVAFPGLPGPGIVSAANDAFEALTFVEFPAAGLYIMGVNSDDGFRVTQGDRTAPGKSMFGIVYPSSIAGEYVGINTQTGIGIGNNGYGSPLPQVPIVAQMVVTDPLDASGPLNNAAAVAGKIAITQRGAVNGPTQTANCLAAGAIAVVGSLAPGDYGQLPSPRGGVGPTTIPFVQISYADGTNIIAHGTTDASSPLVARISKDDASLTLGEFNGGRGSTDTTFGVYVPQPGVYPLRLLWENGGGDLNCEFFTVDPTGTKTLVNDVSGLKAWIQRTAPAAAHLNQPTVNGNTVTISWTGGGELEYSYDVASGQWYKAPNQLNPQTVTLNPLVNHTYYRVRTY